MAGGAITQNDTLHHVSERMKAESIALARGWLERLQGMLALESSQVFPSHQLLDHIPELIEEIAGSLAAPASSDIATNEVVLRKAAELGELRQTQHATVHQLLREYEMLGELLEEFVAREIAALPRPDPMGTVLILRRLARAVRVVQQRSIDTFVARYTETLERQTTQLRKFSRLVSHEIRQPLAVLQVIAKTLQVDPGDVQTARMLDIYERSLARLTDVTGKLERLARITRATDLSPSARRVDLEVLVTRVAEQLADAATARGVTVHVRDGLPVLWADPARVELVFLNLIANGIKYADLAKENRFVEIYKTSVDPPAVIVRDNGVGITSARLQDIFREFVRAHSQRDEHLTPRGLGLGLSIVRECMDHADGSVRVESREGKGTTFRLTWPAPQSSQAPETPRAAGTTEAR